ncbi:dienelactone hydrolase family protein [Variovorax sp. J31P207]|uniref:dienelactone hydrolase family protein n=1 Tax=Variovorax sp. J31P207 TaxID=3053510 RepID=UPI0025771287|nr:dienelactone hydrolase family protein [Variovorax sp. J31P207]MDM0065242.1 dienelactone hydrolase family protein [Variovorax sp. J31P207]
MDAYYTRPARAHGTIVLIQEIFGVTPAMRSIADDLANSGYAVLVPDIYWRLARNLNLGNGEDDNERQQAVDYSLRYDEGTGALDLAACADWLQAEQTADQRPIVFGFCLGGRMAIRMAAATPLSGMISMYGVGLNKLGDLIQGIECPLQFHFGTNDNHNPVEVIEAVSDAVTRRGRDDDEFYTYEGAEHAFYNRFRADRFNPDAHELAKARALRFAAKCFGDFSQPSGGDPT